jgi:hypothetical protein
VAAPFQPKPGAMPQSAAVTPAPAPAVVRPEPHAEHATLYVSLALKLPAGHSSDTLVLAL